MNATQMDRLAVIAALAEKQAGMGRTQLMKYCYLLQTLRKVPLGYYFTLYTYGPFDSDVLSDLSSCEAMGGVGTTLEHYPGGYGYKIIPGPRREDVKSFGAEFLAKWEESLNWVVGEFGGYSAAELELLSTIVYADRELKQATFKELVQVVQGVKPRFVPEFIGKCIAHLREQGHLVSLPR